MIIKYTGADNNFFRDFFLDSQLRTIEPIYDPTRSSATSVEFIQSVGIQTHRMQVHGSNLGFDLSDNLAKGTVTGFKFEISGRVIGEISDINWSAAEFHKALDDVEDTRLTTPSIAPLVSLLAREPITINALDSLALVMDKSDLFTAIPVDMHIGGSLFNDILLGSDGVHNLLRGEDGKDTLIGGNSGDLLQGDAGRDLMKGRGGNDEMMGGTGGDRMFGGSGNDTMFGDNGRDRMFGGAGSDKMSGDQGNDILRGGKGNDLLIGGNQNDFLIGGTGRDILKGGRGVDVLWGGNQADRLKGGGGKDLLNGGKGKDVLTGGNGVDTFEFNNNHGADRITDFTLGVDNLLLSDELWGSKLLSDQEVVDKYASLVNGDVQFNFGNGNLITMTGVTSTTDLAGDLDQF